MEQQKTKPPPVLVRDFKCSFCGRRPDQVRNLLAQGAARICNLCVADFTRRLAAERDA